MKYNLYAALLVLASLFTCFSNVQAQFVSDSLSVYWEQLDGPPGYVLKYAEGGGKLFAATEGGLYYSTDGGKNWKFNLALGKHKLLNIFVKDDVVFVLARRELLHFYSFSIELKPLEGYALRSTDGGDTWEQVFDTDNWPGNSYNYNPKSTDLIFKGDSTLFLRISTNSHSKIWISQNLGETWQISTLNNQHYLGLLNVEGATAGIWSADNSGVWKGLLATTEDFDNFQTIPLNGLQDLLAKYIRAAYQNGAFYVFLSDRTLFKSNDFGTSWEADTLQVSGTLKEVIWAEDEFFFHTTTGVWRGTLDLLSSNSKIYNGEDGSNSNAATFSKTESGYWINNNLYTSLYSPDLGQSWIDRSKGLVSNITYLSSVCGKLAARSATLGASIYAQYLSNEEDGEWNSSNHKMRKILGDANGYSFIYGPPLMRSGDCGITWDTIKNVSVLAEPERIIQTGNRIYLWNKFGAPISFTDDSGLSWTEIQTPFEFADCSSFQASGDTLYFLNRIGNNTWTLYRSPDIGQIWESIPLEQNIGQLFWNEKKQLVGVVEGSAGGYIFLSTDFGSTWTQTFNTTEYYPYILNYYGPSIRFPLVSEGLILMQAAEGVYITHNEGVNWTRLQNLPFFNFTFDPVSGQNPTIGGYTEGASFFHANEGYLYAVTETQGIWRTELAPIRDHALVNGSKYGILQGQLYRDLDNSCDYNATNGDVPLGHKPLNLQPGNRTAITDANGKYSVAVAPGNYTISAAAPLYHFQGCAVGQPFAVNPGATTEANIAFQPEPGIKDLCILFTTPMRARPGFLVNYTVQVNNLGTTAISGAVLTVDFDAPWLEASTISPFGQYVGNQAIIPIPDLAPGQVIIFTLSFSVSVNTSIGTELSFLAFCPLAEDAQPSNNRVAVFQTVTGSYDPNDKTAQPVQAQLPFQPRNFDYLIRFQNTGTDTAFTVIVTDTLDARFDLLSIRTLESSHAFEFRLMDGRVAKWIFRNILLPDSNINEVGSHGYIRFQIETKPDALPGAAIPNDADIFFDFNSPIRTNESLAENPKWLVTNTTSVALCEGDSWNGSIWKASTTLIDTTSDVWSDTILLREILVSPSYQVQFDTTITAGETIFGIPVMQDTAFVFQYQSAEGCDSTIAWNVTVLTSGTKDVLGRPIHVELFPNPTTLEAWLKVVHIDAQANKTLKIRILDTTGRLWQETEDVEMQGSEVYKLSIEGLPVGIYFIEIRTPEFKTTRRMVKI